MTSKRCLRKPSHQFFNSRWARVWDITCFSLQKGYIIVCQREGAVGRQRVPVQATSGPALVQTIAADEDRRYLKFLLEFRGMPPAGE